MVSGTAANGWAGALSFNAGSCTADSPAGACPAAGLGRPHTEILPALVPIATKRPQGLKFAISTALGG